MYPIIGVVLNSTSATAATAIFTAATAGFTVTSATSTARTPPLVSRRRELALLASLPRLNNALRDVPGGGVEAQSTLVKEGDI